MKMDASMVEKALGQLEAQAIPEEHPVLPQLNQMFGEHTFFLSNDGLHVIEPVSDGEPETGRIVKIASWSDPERTSLVPHEPEASETTVDLGGHS